MPGSAEGWFLLGAACHCQGRAAEAADCYTRALTIRPDATDIHNNLGSVLRTLGRTAEAEASFRQALRLRPQFPEAHNNLGNVLRDLGQLAEATRCFRQALQLRPDMPEALINLGNVLRDQKQPAEAEGVLRRVVGLRPDLPEAHVSLGNVLHDLGRFDDATACFRRALELRPNYPEAHYNLGNVLRDQKLLDDAAECFRQAVRLRPDYPECLNNLGIALRDLNRPAEAEEFLRQAIRLRPDHADAHNNLGLALHSLGRLAEAELCFAQALRLRPDTPEAHFNMGATLRELGRPAEAEGCLRQALRLRPDYPEAHAWLGIVLRDVGRPTEAEAAFRRALELRPDYPEALANLATALQDQVRYEEARECFRQALELRPEYLDAHNALLLTLQYQADTTPEQLAVAHTDYQERLAAPLRSHWRPHTNDRDPDRPLRLGLVSGDFGRHPVGFLLVRAVEALAHRPCAIVCYSNRLTPPDDLTVRFRSSAATWREAAGLTDDQLADLVRADRIDVLIDLAGHTGGNRLLVFARKPAPVQVTWLGYEGTTGLEAIDYLVADERVIPPGAETNYCEKVLRLPGGYACYDPLAGAPDPGPLPALAKGQVTFGCFNNPAKLSPPALAAFAQVLNRVPGSRLLLKYRGLSDPVAAGRLRERLAAAGMAVERVDLRGPTPYLEYLAAYREVDVALDSFPFGGGVTTCDALWMGVPVVTLPGRTFASRHGLSHLWSAGLADQLAARDVDDYVARAAELAQDLDRLAGLRAQLRERVARSPLCDGGRVADELMAALRTAWREWVAKAPVP
jgi:predicted O-linked N-acetylglucosamine transferase (SPINDLY family)